jgi:excisionase family DNA binding protein
LSQLVGEGVEVERLALSVAEAAAVLGVSKDAIYDAVRCHELPAIRIRRRILIPLAALEQLLDQKKAG